jgi:hypothetical protein
MVWLNPGLVRPGFFAAKCDSAGHGRCRVANLAVD